MNLNERRFTNQNLETNLMHETLMKCYILPLTDRIYESIKKPRNWRNYRCWRSNGMQVKWATWFFFQTYIPCWQKVRGFFIFSYSLKQEEEHSLSIETIPQDFISKRLFVFGCIVYEQLAWAISGFYYDEYCSISEKIYFSISFTVFQHCAKE